MHRQRFSALRTVFAQARTARRRLPLLLDRGEGRGEESIFRLLFVNCAATLWVGAVIVLIAVLTLRRRAQRRDPIDRFRRRRGPPRSPFPILLAGGEGRGEE